MKRDMELIRAILLAVNERITLTPEIIKLDEYDEVTVKRHVAILFDAGYLEGLELKNGRSMDRDIAVTDMSWEGHEFLAATQNNGVWQKMKTTLSSEMIEAPVQLLKEIAMALIKQQVKSALNLSSF